MISEQDYTKSSFSAGGACVEVRLLPDGLVGVRDSKDRAKTPHFFTAQEWSAFLAGVRNGEFDLRSTDRPVNEKQENESPWLARPATASRLLDL